MSAETLELLRSGEFLTALLLGSVAVTCSLVFGAMWHRERDVSAPMAGLLLVVAYLIAGPRGASPTLLLALGVLTLGGGLRVHLVWRSIIAVVGAVLLSTTISTDDPNWFRVFVIVVVPVGAILVADFDDRYRHRALGPGALAVSAVALFFAVPDTERALLLLGVSLPLLAVVIRPVASLGGGGSYAVVGIFVWTAIGDAAARPAVAIAAVATLGLLLLEPVMVAIFRVERPLRHTETVTVLGAQLVVGYIAARIAAPRRELGAVMVFTLAALGIAAAFVYLSSIRSGRERSRRSG